MNLLKEHRDSFGQDTRKPMAKPELSPGKRGSVRKKLKMPFLESLWYKREGRGTHSGFGGLDIRAWSYKVVYFWWTLFPGLAYPEGLGGSVRN